VASGQGPEEDATSGLAADGDAAAGELRVGLVADPGLPAEIAGELAAGELAEALSEQAGGWPRWRVEMTSEALPLNEDGMIPLIELADQYREREGWDAVMFLTDLPRRSGTEPVAADVSIRHAAALISLPGIGWIRVRACVRDTIVYLLGRLTEGWRPDQRGGRNGSSPGGSGAPAHPRPVLPRRPAALGWMVREAVSPQPEIDLCLVLIGWRGRARLLFGMVRDNRPWVLVPHLASATAAAAAAAAVSIFYSSIWGMAEALPPWRLILIMMVAITAMAAWLLVYNHLWEPPAGHRTPAEAVLYNLSTAVTLVIGVACMYGILFVLALLAALVVIDTSFLHSQLGHPVGIRDYATIVWLASSIGVVAGALGSSLDSEEAVLKAAYSRREQERRARNLARAAAGDRPTSASGG
jgi:hypothetical protein